jgi:hypothetical protein
VNKKLSIETPLTKTFSWTEPLDCFSEKEFKHNWKNVADHIRYTLMEDLINPTDYGKINIDAESGQLYIHVTEVKPELWNYFEEERYAQGELNND